MSHSTLGAMTREMLKPTGSRAQKRGPEGSALPLATMDPAPVTAAQTKARSRNTVSPISPATAPAVSLARPPMPINRPP